jgi:hypothetical protein
MRDRVPHFRRGQRLRGEHLKLIRQAALQFSAQPGTIYDGTGVYTRRLGAQPQRETWVQLSEALHPNAPAAANPVVWSQNLNGGIGGYSVASEVVTVRDYLGMFWGLAGERIRVYQRGAYYEARSSGAPWHLAQLDDDLQPGYSQTASVYGGINGVTALLTVHAQFSSPGYVIPSQAFVGVQYDAAQGRWVVSEAICNW